MGVPKFFRYISERYPCLSELAREECIPEFDNLYLDMNGIIHNCSHPDDLNTQFNLPEEEIFKDIFNYIDKLFFLIKPQKVFYMAVDGVAPRAKMNQQRSRRFRSAKEAETIDKLAISRGEEKPERFDTNCITPGTEFMERLHNALCNFVKIKISADPLWQKCRVILSGHNCVGEGEHKIMEYIRAIKSDENYNPNTRHCLYGLDADLIILGLCTHELHFVVLREEVKFGRKTKKASVEETRFFLLHLGLLREYLEMEFDELKQQDPNFDIANLIDDWVLMGFLVGNDFIPHLPCMHISSNALPLLYNTYKKVYSSLGGNINEAGKINLSRLEKYLAALAEVEFEIFQENYADLKYFEAKLTKNGIDETFDFDVNEIDNEKLDDDMAALIESSRQFLEDDEDLSDNEQHINDEFENYKRNYYMNKLNIEDSNGDGVKALVNSYITALQWILFYYYRGVNSWDWYYPFHYAPFISDLKNFQDIKLKFNIGKPFTPFQQLLAVLPAPSRYLLPTPYQELMTNSNSELIDYYPENFETDLNGKKHDWEAVVLLPFIDEDILINAMATCTDKLTASERKRNEFGPMLEYEYQPEGQGQGGKCSVKSVYSSFSPQHNSFRELPNAARTVFFPGFPTMKHLKYKFEIKCARVKVFDYPSRNDNMILQPENRKNLEDVYTVAEKYLNQVVFIGWPHLIKAKVVAISNKEKYIDGDGIKDMHPHTFDLQVRTAKEHLSTRMGIEFSDYSVMVHARIYLGSSYVCGSQGKVNMTEIWRDSTTAYPAQGVVSEIEVHKSLKSLKKIEQLFPENSRIFFIGSPYFGSEGIVMNPMLVYECGRLKVNITVLPEPDFTAAKYIQSQLERDYVNSYQAASQIGINVKSLARVTGSILVVKGPKRPKSDLPENLPKLNIGLQFKYVKQQEELAGYARRIDNQWFLSSKAITIVQAYVEKFPIVFEYLGKVSDRPELLFEQDLFPDEIGEKKVEEIVAWIKTQDHINAERIPCGSKTMEKESVERILDAIENLKCLPVKTVKLQVKPHLLLKPDVSLPEQYKSKRPIRLFDRVVVVKTTYMVPLGSKGTVVGIYPVSDPNPVRLECIKAVDNFYEVLFDKHIPNGNDIHSIAAQRVCKVPESSVLLIFTSDNNKQNESSYEQKICHKIDDQNNSSTLSWRQSKPVTNLFTAPTLLAQEKSNDVKIPQPVQQSVDNFWTPALNTKQKHSDTFKNVTSSNEGQNMLHQFNNQTEPMKNVPGGMHQYNESTQILKSLLGLSMNQSQIMTETAVNSKPQLPQPPTSWRAEAQKIQSLPNNLPCMPPTQYLPNTPLSLVGNTVGPHSTAQQIVPQYQHKEPVMLKPEIEVNPQEQQTTTYNLLSHQYLRAQRQQHQHYIQPQEKIFNPNSLNQKGAFIPLQVVRGTKTLSQNTPSTSISSTDPNNFTNKNNIFVPNQDQMTTLNNSDRNNIDQQADVKPIYGRKKPPRVPKIGAKFDNAQ